MDFATFAMFTKTERKQTGSANGDESGKQLKTPLGSSPCQVTQFSFYCITKSACVAVDDSPLRSDPRLAFALSERYKELLDFPPVVFVRCALSSA